MIGKTRHDREPSIGATPHGVLRPHLARRQFVLERVRPSPDMAYLIERFWTVSWDLRDRPPHRQVDLPYPNVNLVAESTGVCKVYGVIRHRFERELAGRGHAFGIKFRPGAFRAVLGAPVCGITDRALPLDAVFGAAAARLADMLRHLEDPAHTMEGVERFLRDHTPSVSESGVMAGTIVDSMGMDRSLTRVAQVAARFGMTERSLQRLFREHVGVSPKWVLQRFRLQSVAGELADGASHNGAKQALSHGYYDQAHFVRAFSALVGVPPAAYVRSMAEDEER